MSHPPPKQLIASVATANTTTLGSDGKPLKLRSACNTCFSAKVRCDGNKESCKRCVDKRITCIYSESRVGKVVGKRRRKRVDDSIGTIESEAWVVNHQQFASIPSPAATTSSSESNPKRHCSEDSWTYFIADDQAIQQECTEASEALQSIDMVNRRSASVESEIQFYVPGGLQTPALSPPNDNRYLTPSVLQARPVSRQASITTEASLIQRTPSAASMTRISDSIQPEDDETVCIKLLAHLKKYSTNVNQQGLDSQLDLLSKGNASVRRILRSPKACGDYTCQFLLSSIMSHLTALCESLCYTNGQPESASSQDRAVVQRQRNSEVFDMRTGLVVQQTSSETLRPLLLETSSLTADIGNLLKHQPLDGFQTLGRWEMYIMELSYRLQSALASV